MTPPRKILSTRECRGGRLLCGEHKKQAIELVLKFVRKHRQRRRRLIGKAGKILGVS